MGTADDEAVGRRYLAEVVSRGDLAAVDELFDSGYATGWPISDVPRGVPLVGRAPRTRPTAPAADLRAGAELIERVWRHLKDNLSSRRWWADLNTLQHATEHLFARLHMRFHRPREVMAQLNDC